VGTISTRRRQALELGQPGLDRGDGGLRVLARTQDDDAAGDLALAVELGDAAPHLGAELHRGHVAQQHRHAAHHGQRDGRGSRPAWLQVAAGAHHVLGLGQFEHRAAGLLVGGHQRLRTCSW
jgi:hypothetical protein